MAAHSESAAAGPFTPLASAFTVAVLGFLAWGVATEAHLGLGGSHLAALLLLVGACAGWLGWVAVRSSEMGERAGAAVTLGVMAAAGGALVPFAPLAVTFVGVAALGATIGWAMRTAGWVIATGLVAMVVSVPAAGHSLGVLSLGFGVALAGAAVGLSRRQSQERAAQAVLLSVERERADIEQARAELLTERNHLARELHDVLAHTLRGAVPPARGPRRDGPSWRATLSMPRSSGRSSARNGSSVKGLPRRAMRCGRCGTISSPSRSSSRSWRPTTAVVLCSRRRDKSGEPTGDARPLPRCPGGADQRHEARAGSGDRG